MECLIQQQWRIYTNTMDELDKMVIECIKRIEEAEETIEEVSEDGGRKRYK